MDNIKKEEEIPLEDILKNEPRPPFSVNLNLFSPDNNDISKLFTGIKNIYIKGLIIQTGDTLNKIGPNNLKAEKVNETHINIMEKHMLSFGIETFFLKMTGNDKTSLFKYLLYDLEKAIPDLNFRVTIDWRTQHILKIDFKLPNEKKEEILKEIGKIILNHNVANIFLKISKAIKLKNHGIIITKKENLDDITVIYFDFANIADYQKIHRCLNDKIMR